MAEYQAPGLSKGESLGRCRNICAHVFVCGWAKSFPIFMLKASVRTWKAVASCNGCAESA